MNIQFFTSLIDRALLPAALSWAYGDSNILKNFAYNSIAVQSYQILSQRVEKAVEQTFSSPDRKWKVGAGFAIAAPIVLIAAKHFDHELSYLLCGIIAINTLARMYVPQQPIQAKL